jgi:hypothetical protein
VRCRAEGDRGACDSRRSRGLVFNLTIFRDLRFLGDDMKLCYEGWCDCCRVAKVSLLALAFGAAETSLPLVLPRQPVVNQSQRFRFPRDSTLAHSTFLRPSDLLRGVVVWCRGDHLTDNTQERARGCMKRSCQRPVEREGRRISRSLELPQLYSASVLRAW